MKWQSSRGVLKSIESLDLKKKNANEALKSRKNILVFKFVMFKTFSFLV